MQPFHLDDEVAPLKPAVGEAGAAVTNAAPSTSTTRWPH